MTANRNGATRQGVVMLEGVEPYPQNASVQVGDLEQVQAMTIGALPSHLSYQVARIQKHVLHCVLQCGLQITP